MKNEVLIPVILAGFGIYLLAMFYLIKAAVKQTNKPLLNAIVATMDPVQKKNYLRETQLSELESKKSYLTIQDYQRKKQYIIENTEYPIQLH